MSNGTEPVAETETAKEMETATETVPETVAVTEMETENLSVTMANETEPVTGTVTVMAGEVVRETENLSSLGIRRGLKREYAFAYESISGYSPSFGRTRARGSQDGESSSKRLKEGNEIENVDENGRESERAEDRNGSSLVSDDKGSKSNVVDVGSNEEREKEDVKSPCEDEILLSDLSTRKKRCDLKSKEVPLDIDGTDEVEIVESDTDSGSDVNPKRRKVKGKNGKKGGLSSNREGRKDESKSVSEDRNGRNDSRTRKNRGDLKLKEVSLDSDGIDEEAITESDGDSDVTPKRRKVKAKKPKKVVAKKVNFRSDEGWNRDEVKSVSENTNGRSDLRERKARPSKLKEVAFSLDDMEDVESEEVTESSSDSDVTPRRRKMKAKKPKKVVKTVPSTLNDILDTGLLEGLPVKYLRSEVRGVDDTGLLGIIKGSKILCSCEKCDWKTMVTVSTFELHAGSTYRRAAEYIVLENGKTLHDVFSACKAAPLDGLEEVIEKSTGCSVKDKPAFCLNCKGQIPETDGGKRMLLCDSCMALKESQHFDYRSPVSVSASNSSSQVAQSSSNRRKGGKLTRKDLRMHKLVFADDVLEDGTALAYYSGGEKLLEGYKMGFAIFCYCCETEVSPSVFEAHAGLGVRRKPYLHIYTSNGVSLHELSVRLASERKFSPDENDDLCSICADGGDLLLCDTCPRAFHPDCVFLPSVPQGKWYCRYCQNMFQREKFVESNANAIAAGRVAGIDPIEQITQRCIRIVETPETGSSACVLCRAYDFSKSEFGPRTVIICDQCEKEFHVGCLKEHNMDNLEELPEGKWFCCKDCERIHSSLQNLVAGGEITVPYSMLSAVMKKRNEKESEGCADIDIKWRLLSGKMASDETRLLLSRAVSIFHDHFDPIANSNTSHLDLIPHMVYGRNFKDSDYGGNYCAILTVNSTVVSAGIFRVFGREVAELPLVATTVDYQGQGYFQSLFACIEGLFGSLDVRKLVLPAADEALSIWTKKFGFKKMPREELEEYRKNYQLMIFQGTSMLQKTVPTSSENATTAPTSSENATTAPASSEMVS